MGDLILILDNDIKTTTRQFRMRNRSKAAGVWAPGLGTQDGSDAGHLQAGRASWKREDL